MIKKIKYIFLFSILLTIGICTHSFARITTNDPTVNSGATVTITVNSQEPVASGAIKLTTSNSGLTFKSASGGTVNGNLVAFAKTNNATSGIATYTFTAPTVSETKTYKLVFTSQDMADEEGNTILSSSATATVTVKGNTPSTGGNTSGGSSNGGSSNTQTKATIKKLVVAGKTYNNPSKNITVKVDNDVTTAKISVTTSNGESFTINKGNNVKLEEGTNTVKITLASGNVYTVNIRRAAKEDDTPNIIDEPKEEEKVLLKSLKLQGVKLEEEKVELSYSPEFSGEVYEYSVNVASDITKIDVKAIASKEDYTVEITGNEELKEGENIITILVKAKDSDKVTTYKIKVIKEEAVEAVATLDETPTTGEELKDNNIIKIIIVTFTALVAIAGIVFAVIEYNYSKKHPKEKMGKIPYSNIGFKDEETDKEDILEEQEDKKEKNEKEESKDKESNAEESKPKKRGKHF